jgi:hypothetical protein
LEKTLILYFEFLKYNIHKQLRHSTGIGTFWETSKEHICIPNIKQGFFGITRPTEAEMVEYR